MDEVFNLNLDIPRPLSLPPAGIIEDYLSMVNNKVLAETSSLK